jgi:hypothetical protein
MVGRYRYYVLVGGPPVIVHVGRHGEDLIMLLDGKVVHVADAVGLFEGPLTHSG